MQRENFSQRSLSATLGALGITAILAGDFTHAEEGCPVRPLAQSHVVVFRSPDPGRVFCYTPGICQLESGRLIATLDLGGPGVAELSGMKASECTEGGSWQGKILTSDDGGATWTYRTDFAGMHARPFVAGDSLYVIGHTTDLFILRSDDGGDSWSEAVPLTEGQQWHQSAANVHYARGCVYLVMERRVSRNVRAWYVSELAPVLMRAKVTDDLTRRESWTFASELPFTEALPHPEGEAAIDYTGIPFYTSTFPTGGVAMGKSRSAPMGWLEANVVEFTDPAHVWHTADRPTLHLWMRAHTAGTGFAAIAKVTENDDGTMTTAVEKVPSGRSVLYVPCPGGQMRFHVVYDDATRLFWLLSSQATDSMTRPDRLPEGRYGLPNNERHRLQLHFSRNMVDWCFAGLVAMGESPRQARHYASMIADGKDLLILSRSGDQDAHSAHDGNIITLHRVKDFRKLVY